MEDFGVAAGFGVASGAGGWAAVRLGIAAFAKRPGGRLRLRLATRDLSMPQFLARRVSRWRRRLPAESGQKRDRS